MPASVVGGDSTGGNSGRGGLPSFEAPARGRTASVAVPGKRSFFSGRASRLQKPSGPPGDLHTTLPTQQYKRVLE